jgi:predicted nucleic acid-binding protein
VAGADSGTLTAVICDTSPIRALAWLGELDLLERLFGSIIVPPAVASELISAKRNESRVDVRALPFIRIESPTNSTEVERFNEELDRGESEALVLAIERNALLIVDDAAARAAALRSGIPIMGTLRLLLIGKQQGRIAALSPLMDRLQRELGFFIDDQLRSRILRDANE